MTEPSSEELTAEATNGIPTGLNRIKTRRVSSKEQLSSKPDELTESKIHVVASSRPPVKDKQKPMAQGRGKSASFKAGPILFYFKVQIDFVPLFLVLIMYS
jgi:hypothetical protein